MRRWWIRRTAWLGALMGALWCMAAPGAAAADEPLATLADCDYAVAIQPQPAASSASPGALQLTLGLATEGRDASELSAANGWAGVTDFDRSLVDWQVLTPGVSLSRDEARGVWRLQHPGQAWVQLRYRVLSALAQPHGPGAQSPDQLYRTQVAQDGFQFFGYGLLPTPQAWGNQRPLRLCMDLQQAADAQGQVQAAPWVGSLMDPAQGASARWQRREQAPLAQWQHAFYAGGPAWRVQTRALPGGPLALAVRGSLGATDAQLADQAARLVATHRHFWQQGEAVERFAPQWLVITPNHSPGSSSGTVVNQAAVLHVPPGFSPSNGNFEFLVGHENLHHWLPRRLGSRAGAPAYWLSEGFTDYYTHRLLLASGLWDLPRYASEISRMLQAYWLSGARNAGEADINARFFSDRDAGRQMYARGELLAMHWDGALRQGPQADPQGLDALLRGLMASATADEPRPAAERVMAALTQRLGAQPAAQLAAHVQQGQDLALPADLAGPCFALGWTERPRWVPGFEVQASFKNGRAQGVQPQGPAWRAGLREGMHIAGGAVRGMDVQREIEVVTLQEGQRVDLRFLPVDGSSDRVPQLSVREGAEPSAACRDWQRR